jgi:hypothetical protein
VGELVGGNPEEMRGGDFAEGDVSAAEVFWWGRVTGRIEYRIMKRSRATSTDLNTEDAEEEHRDHREVQIENSGEAEGIAYAEEFVGFGGGDAGVGG